MPKKVKTRKQKILADSRRKLQGSVVNEAEFLSYSLPQQKVETENTLPSFTLPKVGTRSSSRGHVATSGYQYLVRDLRKTLLLTLSIIAAQMLISFLMR